MEWETQENESLVLMEDGKRTTNPMAYVSPPSPQTNMLWAGGLCEVYEEEVFSSITVLGLFSEGELAQEIVEAAYVRAHHSRAYQSFIRETRDIVQNTLTRWEARGEPTPPSERS